jgi:hypothetical protein
MPVCLKIMQAKVINLRENTIVTEETGKVMPDRQFIFLTYVVKKSNPLKTKSTCMKDLYYNDTAYIAQSFHLSEDYTAQTARLAFFKINSYKLSLVKSSFSKSRKELVNNLKDNLFNYTNPGIILADLGFFQSEYDN